MTTPEEIQSTLKHLRLDSRVESRRVALAQLPTELCKIGCQLIGIREEKSNASAQSNPRSMPNYWQEISQAAEQISTLTNRERVALFAALFPEFGDGVEAGWQLLQQLPYSTNYQRRPFRAPNQPDWYQHRRSMFVVHLLGATANYAQDLIWWVRWSTYTRTYHDEAIGLLCAAILNKGGSQAEDLFQAMAQLLAGTDPIGVLGRHVVVGLLTSARPDCWALVERLLLTAQRQEGVRQMVLEAADFAHPHAFRQIVQLIQEHDLVRFSAVTRAVDVWFGLRLERTQSTVVRQVLTMLHELLALTPDECLATANGGEPRLRYLALCVAAMADIEPALRVATELLQDPSAATRLCAATFIREAQLPAAEGAMLPLLHDADLRVATMAFHHLLGYRDDTIFAAIEAAIPHFPQKRRNLDALVWPWEETAVCRQDLYDALTATYRTLPITRLLPYMEHFSPRGRSHVAHLLQQEKQYDQETATAVVALLGDRSDWVRRTAGALIDNVVLTPAIVTQCESYLTRQSGDLRRHGIRTLLRQSDSDTVASAQRLLQGKVLQQLAALEMLVQLKEAGRAAAEIDGLVTTYRAQQPTPSDECARLLQQLARPEALPLTLTDGLGLFDPAQRTAPTPPRANLPVPLVTTAAQQILEELDALIHENRQLTVQYPEIKDWQSGETVLVEELLGNVSWRLPSLDPVLPDAVNWARVPLPALWQSWWEGRGSHLRDTDELELIRAKAALNPVDSWRVPAEWERTLCKQLYVTPDKELRYFRLLSPILSWLTYFYPPPSIDLLLDATEKSLALCAKSAAPNVWREQRNALNWLDSARVQRRWHAQRWSVAQHARLWGLQRWFDEPNLPPVERGIAKRVQQLQQWWQQRNGDDTVEQLERYRPGLADTILAWQAGVATEADLLELLIGDRGVLSSNPYRFQAGRYFSELREASGRKPLRFYQQAIQEPRLERLVERCRQRIVAIEQMRGETPTLATAPARALRYSGGADALIGLLAALGNGTLERGWSVDGESKKAVLSHLIRVTGPTKEDTPEHFVQLAQRSSLPTQRWLECALFAPQWARHIQALLGWPALADAVWWFHAHTKGTDWQVEPEIRTEWASQIAEQTPLTAQDLIDGAVDSQWFWRVYTALGAERWQALDETAIFAASGSGHTRAQLFANTLLNRVAQEDLMKRIRTKRHQDSVRALGLLPLLQEDRTAELLQRYQLLQEFLAGSRKFGSQRQASEKLAVRIGMENLARTAGYPDPLRLQWAMEEHALADLAAGPILATVDDITVSLTIDALGNAQIEAIKKGKVLKTIPPRVKKNEAIKALLDRATDLKQQLRRMRLALEQAMERGDYFYATELDQLMHHALLRPLLEDLILMDDEQGQLGYPTVQGGQLVGLSQHLHAYSSQAKLRLAHPFDLYQTGQWSEWQRECFAQERIQPFKQVFRELYLLTPAERQTATFSQRYAGQQVNPRQAFALLGQRGWVVRETEGIHRTFYDEHLTAWIDSENGLYTPLEVEGLTIRHVFFTRRGEWERLLLDEIPPRVFSTVMRDVDLIVSVTHLSGVDPESSMSTIELRAALVDETARLLKLNNVHTSAKHVFVEGSLSSYTIHLGSGVVHRQPGGYLCIVPVHSQQRGRLFLPFVDDDPKSAEIVAKMVLLARDREIKDPLILEQIVPKG